MYKHKCNYNYHGKISRKRDRQNSIHTKSINPLHKHKQSRYFIILKISTLTLPMIECKCRSEYEMKYRIQEERIF